MKKFLSLTLASMMLLGMLAACSNADGDSQQTNDPAVTTAAPAVGDTTPTETADPTVDANGYKRDDLPADLNFNNETITMLYWEDAEKPEFFVEDYTGEVVNDALLNRNRKVEERIGVKLEFVGTKGNYNNQANFVTQAQNSVNSGGDIDIFAGYSMTGATLAVQGLSQNLLDLKYINFDQPWWPASLIDETTINNKLYFCSGDIATSMLHFMYGEFVNRDMLKDFNLEDPYTLVEEGKWTIDKMFEMAKGVYSDLDGDGALSLNDRYGLVTSSIHFDSFFPAAGLRTVEKSEDGKSLMISPLFNSEKTVNLLEKINSFFHDSGEVNLTGTGAFFELGQTLFTVDRVYMAENRLRDVEFDYGVVPVPKWDEAQENYITCMAFPFTLYSISSATQKADIAAATLECLGSEGYRQVTPMLFETAMKVKYATNDKTAQMYDLIRESVVIDLGRIFTTTFNNYTYSIFRNAVSNNQNNALQQFKLYEKLLNKSLDKINPIYE